MAGGVGLVSAPFPPPSSFPPDGLLLNGCGMKFVLRSMLFPLNRKSNHLDLRAGGRLRLSSYPDEKFVGFP